MIASSAESSDHQNPGACRARIVAMRPIMPLARRIHAKNTVAATEAITGARIASDPRMSSAMPSHRNRTQWSRTAAPRRSPTCCTSEAAVMIVVPYALEPMSTGAIIRPRSRSGSGQVDAMMADIAAVGPFQAAEHQRGHDRGAAQDQEGLVDAVDHLRRVSVEAVGDEQGRDQRSPGDPEAGRQLLRGAGDG